MEQIVLEVKNLLNFSKAAQILGVSRPTLYKFIKQGKLHPVSIGRNRFLALGEVQSLKREEQ